MSTISKVPLVMSADTLGGDDVVNPQGEDLGKIEDIMIDMSDGKVAYGVLSFGGFLGMGNKLFAVPWNSLQVDPENKRFVLNFPKERLENAPGFDKDNWPNMSDPKFKSEISSYYAG